MAKSKKGHNSEKSEGKEKNMGPLIFYTNSTYIVSDFKILSLTVLDRTQTRTGPNQYASTSSLKLGAQKLLPKCCKTYPCLRAVAF